VNAQGYGVASADPYFFLHDLVDSRAIEASDGNANLGVRIPAVDAMIDTALSTTDRAARERIWGDIDEAVMKDATVFPGVWSKSLLYRPDNLTNVFVNEAFGMYDYAAIGTSRK
jgi:peptide/nickel transport system substrate-binding protein